MAVGTITQTVVATVTVTVVMVTVVVVMVTATAPVAVTVSKSCCEIGGGLIPRLFYFHFFIFTFILKTRSKKACHKIRGNFAIRPKRFGSLQSR